MVELPSFPQRGNTTVAPSEPIGAGRGWDGENLDRVEGGHRRFVPF